MSAASQVASSSFPPLRQYHVCATHGSCIYMFGGRWKEKMTDTNDLFEFDVSNKKWNHVISQHSSPVKQMSLHSAVIIRDTLVVSHFEDIVLFNFKTKEWCKIEHSSLPNLELGHTSCVHHVSTLSTSSASHQSPIYEMICYGAFRASMVNFYRLSFSCTLNTKNNTFDLSLVSVIDETTRFDSHNSMPSVLPLLSNHAVVVHSKYMYITGGYDHGEKQTSARCYRYHLELHRLDVIHELPHPLQEHTAVLYDDKIFVFGGRSNGNKLSKQLFELDLMHTPSKWRSIPLKGDEDLPPICGHACSLFQADMYITGGEHLFKINLNNYLVTKVLATPACSSTSSPQPNTASTSLPSATPSSMPPSSAASIEACSSLSTSQTSPQGTMAEAMYLSATKSPQKHQSTGNTSSSSSRASTNKTPKKRIFVITPAQDSEPEPHLIPGVSFQSFFNDASHSDLVLKIEEKQIYTNSIVLCSFSNYFKQMCSKLTLQHPLSMYSSETKPICHIQPLPNVQNNARILEKVIMMMYGVPTKLHDPAEIFQVIIWANKLEIKCIIENCVGYLRKIVSVSTVCKILKLIRTHKLENLLCHFTHDLLKYICDNAEQLLEKADEHELSLLDLEIITTILKRDDFNAVEVNVFKFVKKYIADSEDRQRAPSSSSSPPSNHQGSEPNAEQSGSSSPTITSLAPFKSKYKELIDTIRFPLIQLPALVSMVQPTGWLTESQYIDAVEYQVAQVYQTTHFQNLSPVLQRYTLKDKRGLQKNLSTHT